MMNQESRLFELNPWEKQIIAKLKVYLPIFVPVIVLFYLYPMFMSRFSIEVEVLISAISLVILLLISNYIEGRNKDGATKP